MMENYAWCLTGISAGVAAASLYFQRRDKQPRLEVALESGLYAGPGGTSPPFFDLVARNVGERTIIVEAATLYLPQYKKRVVPGYAMHTLHFGVSQFPCRLEHGESCSFHWFYHELAVEFAQRQMSCPIKLKASFRDALGRYHESPATKWNYEEWLRNAA